MKPLILFFLIALNFSLSAQISLEECQQKARLNYPLIKQFDLIEKSREYTISNANKAYLPQLGITAIGGMIDGFPDFPSPGAEASTSPDFKMITVLQFNQTIWDGGITKANKGLSNAQADIEKADVEIGLHSIVERVNNIYFGILLIDGQREQLELLTDNLYQNLKTANAMYLNGAAYKSDVDEVNVQILDAQQKIAELDYNKSAYIKMLSTLIGEEIDEEAVLQKPVAQNVYPEFEINRPELELFNSQSKLIESKSNMDKSKIFPKVGLMGFGTFIQPGVDFGTQEFNKIVVAGLSLSWQFGSLYSKGNDKKIGEVNLQKIKNQRESFLFSTNLQLSQTEREIEKFEALLKRDREMIKLKSSIKDSYQSKFDNGVTTMSDLLVRINDENMAQQNLVLHEIKYMMAIYQYKSISGN